MSVFDEPQLGARPCDGARNHAEPSGFTGKRARKMGAWLASVCALGLALSGCDQPNNFMAGLSNGKNDQYGCPRPASLVGDNFNDQEIELRELRRKAFSNDFFAQLTLADRYAAKRATDKNVEDPIESSVWLAMALTNTEGYEPMNRYGEGRKAMSSRYDKCRAYERSRAYKMLDQQLAMMDSEERDKVKDRVTYILSSYGADGFLTLARLYDRQYGPMGEASEDKLATYAKMKSKDYGYQNVKALFQRSDVDAFLYHYKAANTGDVSAYVLLKDFEKSASDRSKYAAFVEGKAKRWIAPYEFYPPESQPAGALPHSDESRRTDAADYAITRMQEIPFNHVGRALNYLNLTADSPTSPDGVSKQSLNALRAMIGVATTYANPKMINLDRLRAIQLAAINGDQKSQLVLAVMYSEGVGVATDYARAFFWYNQAAKQGSGEAKYAMATYFSLGLAGVSDQNRAESVVLHLGSALDGFKPSVDRLQAILAQVGQSGRTAPRYDRAPTGYDAGAEDDAVIDDTKP